MTAQIDTTTDAVFAALRAFLLGVLPAGVEVVQTQDNRVPLPIQGPGFVTMSNVHQRRLATNVAQYTDTTKAISAATEYQIQVDMYGDASGEWSQIVSDATARRVRDQGIPAWHPAAARRRPNSASADQLRAPVRAAMEAPSLHSIRPNRDCCKQFGDNARSWPQRG